MVFGVGRSGWMYIGATTYTILAGSFKMNFNLALLLLVVLENV